MTHLNRTVLPLDYELTISNFDQVDTAIAYLKRGTAKILSINEDRNPKILCQLIDQNVLDSKKLSSWDWKSQDWFVSIYEIGSERRIKLLNELVKLKTTDDWSKTIDDPLHCKIMVSPYCDRPVYFGDIPKKYLPSLDSKIKIESNDNHIEFTCHFSNRHFLSKLIKKEWFTGLTEIDDPAEMIPPIVSTSNVFVIAVNGSFSISSRTYLTNRGFKIIHSDEGVVRCTFVCQRDHSLSSSDFVELKQQPWYHDIKSA